MALVPATGFTVVHGRSLIVGLLLIPPDGTMGLLQRFLPVGVAASCGGFLRWSGFAVFAMFTLVMRFTTFMVFVTFTHII